MKLLPLLSFLSFLMATVSADDFPKLDEAMPINIDIATITPLFDYDGDGCLPSAGISRTGAQNAGLRPTGTLGGDCRSSDFMALSNTYHRYACLTRSSSNSTFSPTTYCGHSFAVYMLKDQTIAGIESGHRHDWEKVMVWTTNGTATHGTYSAHASGRTAAASAIPQENGHMKFVYHKDGWSTHAIRFAGRDEVPENPTGQWVTPTIVSWYTMTSDDVSNAYLREKLNAYNYGSATFPQTDGNFVGRLNALKPSTYPLFTQASIEIYM